MNKKYLVLLLTATMCSSMLGMQSEGIFNYKTMKQRLKRNLEIMSEHLAAGTLDPKYANLDYPKEGVEFLLNALALKKSIAETERKINDSKNTVASFLEKHLEEQDPIWPNIRNKTMRIVIGPKKVIAEISNITRNSNKNNLE